MSDLNPGWNALDALAQNGDTVISAAMEVVSKAVSAQDKVSATMALRAARTAVQTRHRLWASWATGKHVDLFRNAIARENLWLRRCQGVVNLMPKHS